MLVSGVSGVKAAAIGRSRIEGGRRRRLSCMTWIPIRRRAGGAADKGPRHRSLDREMFSQFPARAIDVCLSKTTASARAGS